MSMSREDVAMAAMEIANTMDTASLTVFFMVQLIFLCHQIARCG